MFDCFNNIFSQEYILLDKSKDSNSRYNQHNKIETWAFHTQFNCDLKVDNESTSMKTAVISFLSVNSFSQSRLVVRIFLCFQRSMIFISPINSCLNLNGSI